MTVVGPCPPRYLWLENFFKDKVMLAMPQRIQKEHRGDERAGNPTSTHGLLCQLLMVNNPGDISEKDDVIKKLINPNVCSNASAALAELRNWQAAARRAREIGLAVPDISILLRACVGIYKHVFESSSCNIFLNARWIQTYNRIDPHRGANLRIEDVEAINNFARAELYALAIANESAASWLGRATDLLWTCTVIK